MTAFILYRRRRRLSRPFFTGGAKKRRATGFLQQKGGGRIHQQHPCGTAGHNGGPPVGERREQPAGERPHQIEQHQPAKPEAEARVRGDAPLEVEGETGVVPGPGAGEGLHHIAAEEFHPGGDDHDPDKHRHRGKVHRAGVPALFQQWAEAEQQHHPAKAVYDAVGPVQHPSVGLAPAVDHHLQEHLIRPAEHRTGQKEHCELRQHPSAVDHILSLLTRHHTKMYRIAQYQSPFNGLFIQNRFILLTKKSIMLTY